MKRLLSILLVLMMLLSLAPATLASDEAAEVPSEEIEEEALPAEEEAETIEEPAEEPIEAPAMEVIEEPEEEIIEEPALDGATSGTCGANLTWTLSGSVLTISGTGDMTNYETMFAPPWHSEWKSITSVVIRDGVTSIGDYAFNNFVNVTSVQLPNTLKRIGYWSLAAWTTLTDLKIPESVTRIDTRAFEDCHALTSVTIPAGVKDMGMNPFSRCFQLQAVYVASGNKSFTAVDGVLFSADKTMLICYPSGKSGSSYTIPSGVTSIGGFAFGGNEQLEVVVIPDSVTNIEEVAFFCCSGLKSITIPQNVASIQKHVFAGCESLTQIVFEGNVPEMDDNVFEEVTATVYYPTGNSTWTSAVMQDYGGSISWREHVSSRSGQCGDKVTWHLDFETGVLTISGTGDMTDYDDKADVPWYADRVAVKSIVVKDGVTSIGKRAFYLLQNVTGVQLPNTIRLIKYRSFSNCTNLTSVKIPESVTAIETEAFYHCDNLASITIPAGVTEIGESHFCHCEKLQAIYVDSGNKSYAAVDGVLFNKDKTVLIRYPAGKSGGSYAIPSGVTKIGINAFAWDEVLQSVKIPDSVTTIDHMAFAECTRLTSITIPKGVSEIGWYAFRSCISLSQIVFKGDAPSINSEAFSDVTATAYYPEGNSTWTSDKRQDYGGSITWEQTAVPTITSVAVTGLDEPAVGRTGDTSVSVPAGAHYSIGDILWYDTTENPNSALTGSWTFQSGHRYVCDFLLLAEEGFCFSDDLIATVNGQPADFMLFGQDGAIAMVIYEKTMPVENYYVVSFSTERGVAPETQYVKKSSGTFGARAKAPEQNPEDPGGRYTFEYWGIKKAIKDAISGEVIGYRLTQYLFANTLKDDLTLYAKWTDHLGDPDYDGKVTPADAAMVLKRPGVCPEGAADVNGDGNVNRLDAALILQYCTGTLKRFPAA